MIPDSYFDKFTSQKYQNRNPVQRHLIKRFVERLHGMFIAAQPAERVLEVGVGQGFLSGYLSERFTDKSFTGVDLAESDIAQLKKNFPRIDPHVGNAYDLSFLEGEFDLVICAEVMEHLDTPERALDQFLALKPKHVILTVPHEPWFMLSNFLRGKNVTRLGNDIEHVNHWGPRSFRRLLSSRFEVVEMSTSYPWLLCLLRPT